MSFSDRFRKKITSPKRTAVTAVVNYSGPFETAGLLVRIWPTISFFPGFSNRFRRHKRSPNENRDNSRIDFLRAIRTGAPVGSYLAHNKSVSWAFFFVGFSNRFRRHIRSLNENRGNNRIEYLRALRLLFLTSVHYNANFVPPFCPQGGIPSTVRAGKSDKKGAWGRRPVRFWRRYSREFVKIF